MPTPFTKGFQRQLFHGSAGSTAGTPVLNATDIDVNGPNQRSDTTTRGDSLSVPIHTEHVVQLVRNITWKMRYKSTDTTVAAFIAVTKTGADIALKVLRQAGGETEYNGDATVTLNSPGPLTEGMVLEFEAVPSRDSDRDPVLS